MASSTLPAIEELDGFRVGDTVSYLRMTKVAGIRRIGRVKGQIVSLTDTPLPRAQVIWPGIGVKQTWALKNLHRFDEESLAYHRLREAAPDLLRVAELLVSWLNEEEGAHALCDKARAAIAKATIGSA